MSDLYEVLGLDPIPDVPQSSGIDIADRVFGYLTVVQRLTRDEQMSRYRNTRNSAWWCRCVCGIRFPVLRQDLVSGNTRSCGCKMKEIRKARRA